RPLLIRKIPTPHTMIITVRGVDGNPNLKHGLGVLARSAYFAQDGASPVIEFLCGAATAALDRGESAAHAGYSVAGAGGLDSGHRLQGLGPGRDGRIEVPLAGLDFAEVAEGHRVGAGEGERAGADAALECGFGPLEVAEVAQCGGRFVGEGSFAEEPDAAGLLVSGLGSAEVSLRLEQRCRSFLAAVVGGQGAGVDDTDEGPLAPTRLVVAVVGEGGGGQPTELCGLSSGSDGS
ncbi:hypothetical protein ACWGHM_42980, partial [Streptomyces sp. NPDC054904]